MSEHNDIDQQNDSGRRAGARRVLARVAVALGALLCVVLGLLVTLLLLLQTNWGANRAAEWLAGLVNPYEQAQIAVGDVDGNWISRLTLEDVTLFRPAAAPGDTTRLAHLDALRLRYDLTDLFEGAFHLQQAGVYDLQIHARQGADSTFALLQPLVGGPPDTVDTPPPVALQVDELVVQNTGLTARYYSPNRDSVLRVRDLDLRVADLHVGRAVRVALEALNVRVTPPGEDIPYTLRAKGRFEDARLTLAYLRLESPRSDVRAEGTLALSDEVAGPLDDVHFTVRAAPLSFKALAPFVPGLDPQKSLRLTAEVRSDGPRLRLDLEAALSGGGRVALEGALTPDREGPLSYQLDARVRDFSLGFFRAGTDSLSGRISANVHLDLEGPSLEQIDGVLRATLLDDTRLAGYALEASTLTARFEDGRARVDLQAEWNGTALTAEGTLRPFTEPVAYDLRARFAGLNVGRFTGAAQYSDLTGTLRVEGRGVDLRAADLTAVLALDTSTVNRLRLTDGRIELRLDGGDLHAEARLTSPQGHLALTGAALGLGTEVLSYRIAEATFENLDVAALVGDSTQSAFTGAFDLRGRGTAPPGLRLSDIDLELNDSFYGTYRIETADLEGRLRERRLYVEGRVVFEEAGRVTLATVIRPFAEPLRLEVTEGAFANLDLGVLAQNPALASALSGTFRLELRGTDPQTLRAEATVTLDSSRFNRQPLTGGQVDLTLADGMVNLTARLETPEGGVRLAATARPFAEPLAFAVRELAVTDLHLGALLDLPELETALTGTLTIEGLAHALADTALADTTRAAPLLERLDLTARLDLARSRINGAVVEKGQLTVQLGDSTGIVRGAFDLVDGRIALDVQLAGAAPRYEGSLLLESVNLGALLGRDTLRARTSLLRVQFEGRGLEPPQLALTGRVVAEETRYATVQVERLLLDFRLREGLLRVDTLLVRSNVARLTGGGPIALFPTADRPSSFAFTAALESLVPLRPLLGTEMLAAEEGRIEGRIVGPAEALRIAADARFRNFVLGDLRAAGAEVQAQAVLGPDRVFREATLTGSIAYLSVPGFETQNADVRVRYGGDEVRFSANFIIDEARNARIAGRVDLEEQRLQLERLRLHLGQDRWQLLQPTTITFGEQIRISGLLLYSEDQQIAVAGVLDLDGRQNLILTIENFRTGAVADLLGYEQLGGRLNGTLVLTGPARAPNLEGTLNYEVTSFGDLAGTLRLQVRYDSLRLRLDALLTHRTGSTLSIEGFLPVDLRLTTPAGGGATEARPAQGPVDLDLRADGFEIGWLRPFLEPEVVTELGGLLTARVHVGGTRAAPQLEGEVALVEGVLGLDALGETYRHIQLNLELEDDQLIVRTARLQSNGGALVAEGTINLSELTLGEFNLDLAANDFQVLSTEDIGATVDADLVLTGTTDRPVLRGDVTVLEGYFYIGSVEEGVDVAEVELDEEALQMLERRFGLRLSEAEINENELFPALVLQLDIEIARDVWLRANTTTYELAVQLTGDLELQKESGGELRIYGTIEAVPERSRVTFAGRRFNITQGTVTFTGPPGEPRLNIEARLPIGAPSQAGSDLVVTLALRGQAPDDLTLDLASNQGLDDTNILSYIVTGRPARQAFAFGGAGEGGALQPAGEIALAQLANRLEQLDVLQGLDVVEIEVNGLTGATVTAGKYLTPRLYLGIRQPFSRGDAFARASIDAPLTQLTLEYELAPFLLVRLVGSSIAFRLNLSWQYAY